MHFDAIASASQPAAAGSKRPDHAWRLIPFISRSEDRSVMTTPTASSVSDVQQLSQAVAGLAEALARSERRHAQLGRMVRWGVLALIALLAFGSLLVFDRSGVAQAQNAGEFPQAKTAVEALNNINANLMVLGEIGRTLQMLSPAIKQAIADNPEVRQYVQEYFEKNNLNPTPEQQQAYAMQAIAASLVRTGVDGIVLMQRIRQDSNAFRDYIAGPQHALHGVQHELEVMNLAMASVPAMAAQMDLMNRNMATMSYSMGSTMGRMGKWMPW
jgi:hypothetical protein